MNQNFILLLSSWGVLAVIVLILAAYRQQLGRQEDDAIHVNDFEAATVTHQSEVAHRIDKIEKWGKTLTILLVLYGIALGVYYLYTLWQLQSRTTIMG
jgi:hypothetical protein